MANRAGSWAKSLVFSSAVERLQELRPQRRVRRGQPGQPVHEQRVKTAGVQQPQRERSFPGVAAEDHPAQARVLPQVERRLRRRAAGPSRTAMAGRPSASAASGRRQVMSTRDGEPTSSVASAARQRSQAGSWQAQTGSSGRGRTARPAA